MKRRALLMVMVLGLAIAAMAESNGPKIQFDSVTHDFGTIKASDGAVECVYDFTNSGDKPLIIVSVTNGGCGCTNPTYTAKPVAPGERGFVKIKFNPAGRRGEFNRQVKVKTNADSKRIGLSFKGVIIP